jgi:hypothetical protein
MQHLDELFHKRSVVVPGARRHQVPIHHHLLLDVLATTLFTVECSLGNRRHATTLDDTGSAKDFYPVTHGGNWLFGVEDVPHDPDQILVVAEVFRCPTTRNE